MRILVVAPDCPYPPNHGGRKDVYTRLELFHSLGYDVQLVFTAYEQPDRAAVNHLQTLCSKVIWVKRTKLTAFLPFFQSFQVRSRSQLSKVSFDVEFDSVILESEYVGAMLDNRRLVARRVGLRIHNNEEIYYRALANSATNLLKKAYFLAEAVYFGRTRDRVFRKVDALYFISHDEFNSSHSENKHFLPTYLAADRFKEFQVGTSVIFVGNLFTHNNLAALKWYLQEVHPLLLPISEYKLIVAGNTRGSIPDFLQGDDIPKLSFIDSPVDLAEVYKNGAVFINPMLSGAGVKIKTVDAIVQGLPVVSTTVGAEGIGLRDKETVLIADDSEHFRDAVALLLIDRAYARKIFDNAHAFLISNYGSAERIVGLL